MQEVLVTLFIVFAMVYLGKKVFVWFKPKEDTCEACAFGKATKE
jgi:hypothetical protein